MREKRNLLISIILGITMGWALGFLRIPFLEKNHSFWVGFLACFALTSIIVFLLFIWNKNRLLVRLMGGKSAISTPETLNKTHRTIWAAITIFLVLGGLISSLLIYKQNKLFKSQAQFLNEKIQEQAVSINTIKNNNLVLLMHVFLDKVEAELRSNAKDSLSDATIARIADLSHAYQSYNNVEGDSLSKNKLSYERGQLLLGLLKLKMDSNTFTKIKLSTTFSGADLRKADLNGADLRKVDLKHANLWGANLQNTKLNGANLYWADLRWADLTKADLKLANLNGAYLMNAKLINANLNGAILQWADLGRTMLNGANFTNSDLLGVNMMKVNFSQTNLTEANLVKVNVEKDWLDQLNKWQIIGAEKIQALYKIVPNKSRINKLAKFRLEKIKK